MKRAVQTKKNKIAEAGNSPSEIWHPWLNLVMVH